MVSKLFVTLEILSLIAFCRRILDDVEVQEFESVIELYEAVEMVLVGVGGDEPCDAFPVLRNLEFIQDFVFPVIWQ